MTAIYTATLINKDGCHFDTATFTNKKNAKKWAYNRGGKYELVITIDTDLSASNEHYLVYNSRAVNTYNETFKHD